MKISKQYLKQIIKEELAHISEEHGSEGKIEIPSAVLHTFGNMPDTISIMNGETQIDLALTDDQKKQLQALTVGHVGQEEPVSAYK